jgi:NAD(P)-dependent dehydrogenase (short-subunit alcohol dehydrogenase family)
MVGTSFLKRLSDKTVVILGGTAGIGFGVACGAIEYGANVIISSSNQKRLDKSLAKLKETYTDGKVSGRVCDLGDTSKLEANVEQLFEWVGRPIDHVVYTAGDSLDISPISDITIEQVQRAQTVRNLGPTVVGKLAVKYMTNSDSSSITFTSGVASHKPFPSMGAASGIASSMEGLTRGLAVELAPIRVNCVMPGPVHTELFDRLLKNVGEQALGTTANATLLNRVAQPDEVAEAYLYTMKDRFCTGSTIVSDGGYLIK